MKWAVYNLNCNSPSFDFITFMQMALKKGAEGVWFIPGQNNHELYRQGTDEKERFNTIIKPACELYGVEMGFGEKTPESVWGGTSDAHSITHLKSLAKPYPVMPTLQALDKVNDKFRGQRPIVISIRNCPYHQSRNSGPSWEQWALDHDAVILKDYFDEPISLDERVAHYELASLNMGVSSGVMWLNVCSLRPYLMFKLLNDEHKATKLKWFQGKGWNQGDQMPWAVRQRIVWGSQDDYKTIEDEYASY